MTWVIDNNNTYWKVPEGADPDYVLLIKNNEIIVKAAPRKPKHNRSSSSRSRPVKRTFHASQVLERGRATLEQVNRVNGCDEPEVAE